MSATKSAETSNWLAAGATAALREAGSRMVEAAAAESRNVSNRGDRVGTNLLVEVNEGVSEGPLLNLLESGRSKSSLVGTSPTWGRVAMA